jgi:hypothetical protein
LRGRDKSYDAARNAYKPRSGVLQRERQWYTMIPYSTSPQHPTEYQLWNDLYCYAIDLKNDTLQQMLRQARPHWHYVNIRQGIQEQILASMGIPATALPVQATGSPLYAPVRDDKPAEVYNDLPAQTEAAQGILARFSQSDLEVSNSHEKSVTNQYTTPVVTCQEMARDIETICYQLDRDTGCATSEMQDISTIVNILGTLIKQYEEDNTVYTVEVMSFVGKLIREAKKVIEL